jgi:hypothetical protein
VVDALGVELAGGVEIAAVEREVAEVRERG